MPRTIRNYQLETRTARLKLEARKRPYWFAPARGVGLGYRRNERAGSWNVRAAKSDGSNWTKSFAIADDYEDANGTSVLTYAQALRAAMEIGRRGRDGVGNGDAACLEQQIAMKAATFVKDDVEPACYLYRHYDPAGDLLYVGITLSPLRRHEKHFAGAGWRHLIVRILIEPFASREQALQAEDRAIREEFPRFNKTHNRRQHPALELRRIEVASTEIEIA